MVGLLKSRINIKKSIVFIIICSFVNLSCYTSGYTVIASVKIPNAYFSQKERVKLIMEKFKEEHLDLMVDSNLVNKYFNKTIRYYSLIEDEQVFKSKKLYPLYPVYNSANLPSWYMFTPDKKTIFVLGLYADGFAISEFCVIDNKNNDSFNNYSLKAMKKQGKKLKKQYKEKFDKELLPLIKPYFTK